MSEAAPRETTTYRGRSLEEVLPKIREELGPDAVIERQRTGLIGGVAGFFQREMIEVDARPARPGEAGMVFSALAGDDDDADLRAATAPPAPDPDRDEGFAAPAMRQIAAQSEPFASFLQEASEDLGDLDDEAPADDWDAWAQDLAEVPPPSPTPPAAPAAPAHGIAAYQQVSEPEPEPVAPPEPEPAPPLAPAAPGGSFFARPPAAREARFAPAPPPRAPEPAAPPEPEPARARPAAAAQLESALTGRGLSGDLAASVVAEAFAHVAPVAPKRSSLKRQVRAALARRIPVQSGFGAAGRTIALVGPAGAGKTRAAAGLAAAYSAGSDLPVVVLSLKPRDVGAELGELLDPHGVAVRPVDDGAAAKAVIGARAGRALVVLDTPAVTARNAADVAHLADELRAAGVTETHVVLPATVAGAVAREALAGYAPLDPAAVLLTHADETDHLGSIVDLAVADRVALSYVVSGPTPGADLHLADPAVLAARLLP